MLNLGCKCIKKNFNMNIHLNVILTINVLNSPTNYITQRKITFKYVSFLKKRHKILIKNSHQVTSYTWYYEYTLMLTT